MLSVNKEITYLNNFRIVILIQQFFDNIICVEIVIYLFFNLMKNELQNIISGKSQVRFGATIQKISNYLKKTRAQAERLKLASKSKVKKQL